MSSSASLMLGLLLFGSGLLGPEVVRAQPSLSARRYFERAERAIAAQNPAVARGELHDAIRAAPGWCAPYVALARLHVVRDMGLRALEILDAQQRTGRPCLGARLLRAEVYERVGDDARALAELIELRTTHLDEVGVLRPLVALAQRQGRWTLALSVTRQLLRLCPEDCDAIRRREAALRLLAAELDYPGDCAAATDLMRAAGACPSG